MNYCLGYLFRASRVSTYPQAELGVDRTYVLEAITAFEKLGWNVKPYIFGDKVPLASVIEDTKLVIGEEETGFLFQPNDKNLLKQALVKAVTAQNKLSEKGKKAR